MQVSLPSAIRFVLHLGVDTTSTTTITTLAFAVLVLVAMSLLLAPIYSWLTRGLATEAQMLTDASLEFQESAYDEGDWKDHVPRSLQRREPQQKPTASQPGFSSSSSSSHNGVAVPRFVINTVSQNVTVDVATPSSRAEACELQRRRSAPRLRIRSSDGSRPRQRSCGRASPCGPAVAPVPSSSSPTSSGPSSSSPSSSMLLVLPPSPSLGAPRRCSWTEGEASSAWTSAASTPAHVA